MNPLLKDILELVLPGVIGGYAIIVIIRERQRRFEIDDSELRKDVKLFMSEFRTYLDSLKMTIHEHTVMQQVTTQTITGLINKMEFLEKRVNTHDTLIALIAEREKS